MICIILLLISIIFIGRATTKRFTYRGHINIYYKFVLYIYGHWRQERAGLHSTDTLYTLKYYI